MPVSLEETVTGMKLVKGEKISNVVSGPLPLSLQSKI